jgi:hypothetical protein
VQAQGEWPFDMAVNLEPKFVRDDRRGNAGEMPADIETVIRRENAPIKDFERSFEERRTGPLEDHRAFLRKVRHHLSSAVREGKLDAPGGPAPPVEEQARQAECAGTQQEIPAR